MKKLIDKILNMFLDASLINIIGNILPAFLVRTVYFK